MPWCAEISLKDNVHILAYVWCSSFVQYIVLGKVFALQHVSIFNDLHRPWECLRQDSHVCVSGINSASHSLWMWWRHVLPTNLWVVVVQSNRIYLMMIAPAKTPPKTPGVDADCMCESCLIQCLLPEWVLSNFDRLDEMVRRWKEMWCDVFFSEVSQATSQVDLLTSKEATSQNKAFCTSP